MKKIAISLLSAMLVSATVLAAYDIQFERGTASQWSTIDPILKQGEPGYDTTNKIMKIGDGTSAWSALSTIVPHQAVTFVGGLDYASINAAQQITLGQVDLSTDVTGLLPTASINNFAAAAAAAAPVQSVAGKTGSVTLSQPDVSGTVPTTLTLTSGNGLTGGGDLSANRTLNVGAGTGITVGADTVSVNTAALPLDGWAAPSDTTANNASTSAHGLLPKLSGNATDILAGDGTWKPTPAISQVAFFGNVEETDDAGNRSSSYNVGDDVVLTEQVDSANAYNTSTKVFTVPSTGVYVITATVTTSQTPTDGVTPAVNNGIRVERNGTIIMRSGGAAGSLSRANEQQGMFSLTQGDTLRFRTFATTNAPGTNTLPDGGTLTTQIRFYTEAGQAHSSVAIRSLPKLGDSSPVAPPAACNDLSNAVLASLGYESVTAYGAVADDGIDDRVAIQAAMDAAYTNGRVTYFPPGIYDVTARTLNASCTTTMVGCSGDKAALVGRQLPGNVSSPSTQLLGSTCGETKPTIRLMANQDTRTFAANLSAIANEPTPIVVMIRDCTGCGQGTTTADQSEDISLYDMQVSNLRFTAETGNQGAVAVRLHGAEGSGIFSIEVDASNMFAGIYECSTSGGSTYDVEITGGRHGIFCPTSKGGPMNFVGTRLYNQSSYPFVMNNTYSAVFAGLSVVHATGPIGGYSNATDYSNITSEYSVTASTSLAVQHFVCLDCKIELTGAQSGSLITTTNRTVHLENTYVTGATNLVTTTWPTSPPSQVLTSATPSSWVRVGDFTSLTNYQGSYGDYGKLVFGNKNDNAYLNGISYNSSVSTVSATEQAAPPGDLISRHMALPICEPKDADVVWAHDTAGVTPSDGQSDSTGLATAMAAAYAAGKRLMFKPGTYNVSSTFTIPAGGKVCGVKGVSFTPTGTPASTRYTVETENAAGNGQYTEIVNLNAGGTLPSGSYATSWGAQWKPWRIRTPSVFAHAGISWDWGNPGPMQEYTYTGYGGGKMYQVTSGRAWQPQSGSDPTDFAPSGVCITDPTWSHLWVEGTTVPLTWYSGHIQHAMPCGGAMAQIINSSNVTILGSKSESSSTPDKFYATAQATPTQYWYLLPRWMNIFGSSNVKVYGYEGLSQMPAGGSLIKIDAASTGVSVVAMGHRDINSLYRISPYNTWYYVEDEEFLDGGNPAAGRISASSIVSKTMN